MQTAVGLQQGLVQGGADAAKDAATPVAQAKPPVAAGDLPNELWLAHAPLAAQVKPGSAAPPPGDEEDRAIWMRFHRSGTCGKNARIERCPDEFINRFNGGTRSKRALFLEWLEHDMSWAAMTVTEEWRRKSKTKLSKGMGLRNRTWLEKKYKDPLVVDEVIAAKTAAAG